VHQTGFRHEVMFYDSSERFLSGAVPFLEKGLESEEPVLVAVAAEKTRLLKGELGAAGERVAFAEMEVFGHNPAHIIPAWRRFVDEHVTDGAGGRGIGEPIWPGRSAVEIDECQRHESLLNVAFGGEPAWSLLCPYDLGALEDEVLEAAARCHPRLARNGDSCANGQCRELAHVPDPFAGSFEPAPLSARELAFDRAALHALRALVAAEAATAGLSPDRATDLVLAASELGANSVRHGGGQGRARLWRENGTVIVEVTDAGRVTEPLVGRVRPTPTQAGGRGLWIANQVCDLVRIRSGEAGTSARLHMSVA
jgi:anti-sigma regulatory factor (Ser/Thr protein kinase)